MAELPPDIKLVPDSLLARLAARYMKSDNLALVLGRRIHLHNISPDDFFRSPRLLRHELKHVEQYSRLGMLRFLLLYGWYSLKFGYYNNPFEKEARAAENNGEPLSR